MRKLSLLLTLFTLHISLLTLLAASSSERPNVLVILVDDQGWGDLSLHGNQNLNTPALDRLAHQGAQFENFYVQPVCSPTRAEFLTGRYYPRGGVYDTGAGGERLDADEQTIADVFRSAGYATAAFGKWHNGTQAPYHPLNRGFDEYYGFTSGHWGSYFDALLDHNSQLVQSTGYLPDDLTNHALDYIQQQTATQTPFFAYLALPTPHSPMQTTDADWARFANKELTSLATNPAHESPDHTRAALAMVENIDWNVGRLLDRIQELGIEENTIVVYFSDNGPNGWRYNGGMRGHKGSTDEGGTRSPLFIRYPQKIQPGTTLATLAADIDLLPTLGQLANIAWQPAQPLDGISLAPQLQNPTTPIPDRTIFSYWSGRISARTQDYRLDHQGHLYHIPTDRAQTSDLAPQQPERAANLQSQIDAWRAELLTPDAANPDRPLTIGYPGLAITQLPARDATWTGHINRSNRWPNCSYLTNWISDSDSITFNADVGQSGTYHATLYYTAPASALGTQITLDTSTGTQTSARIQQAHTPPSYGMEHDRVPREESYVKDFATLDLGEINLSEGPATLTLSTRNLPSETTLDFRLLCLNSKAFSK